MSWFERAGATLGQYLKGKDVYDKAGDKQEIDDILKMGIGAAPKRVADKETPDTEELSPIKKMAFLTTDLLEEDIRQYIKWLDQVVAKGIEGKLETADDYYDVAVLYMEFGRYQSAIDNLNTAMGITPNFPDALNTLGVCYTKQEEYEKSIEFYDKALEQQSNHPGFILNIAISQFMLGNKGLAKQKYDEAVALSLIHISEPTRPY